MEFENLLTLIKTVSDSELTDFAYEENGTSIHLKKKKETVVVAGNQLDVPIAGLAAAQAAASSATVNAETVQAASSEPEDSVSGTEQSAASSSEAPAEKKQQEAACEAEVKALIQQTYALKAIAEKGLNSSISAAKAEYKTLPAEQQTKTKKIMICLSKTGELTSLQSYCDKEMGRIVSQLRTVLKENGQSTELADQVMSTYKAEKSQRYAELKN